MKTVCVYHSIDLDGWMSAAIVKHWFMSNKSNFEIGERKEDGFLKVNSIEFIGYNYGQPIPNLSEYAKVIMCDISFPKEEMLNLWATKGLNFEWIDHHISAIKMMEDAHENISSGVYPIQGLRNTEFAACELTWKYFFPNETMPEIVRLLGRYDCFGHKGTDEERRVLEFQYGARAFINNHEVAYKFLIGELIPNNTIIKDTWKQGQGIYSYLCTEAVHAYKNGFHIRFVSNGADGQSIFRELIFICINKERFNPINFGINYHKDGYDGAACFHVDSNGVFCFSLYNDNGEVDCSEIAKQYGGGGHKGAAGFRLTKEDFLTFIK